MTGFEIKQAFLDYFKHKQHTIVSSSSLVPQNDPTLLFTNAGMVQFKGLFLGQEQRGYTRAASSQKCVRAGGKHNDLENVGHTARHHTFFEMLGNFSFGDYFKEQAIEYGWEFLTQRLKLAKDKLWVTIYKDDEQAGHIWQQRIGLPAERIVRLGEKDNFWSMGDIGPCGPCSEIIIDQGPELGCGQPDCRVGCDCDRYLELWNLVFMQYERTADGKLEPLPKPSIDTGMGLERITAVVQGKHNNFDTDLFGPIIEYVADLSSLSYEQNREQDVSFRVIADHIRATAFLISDGVMPANEGRGYVLRRIIRRAARHGKKLGLHQPFLHQLAGVVADIMGDSYPELQDRREFAASVTRNEEQRFAYTLEQGLGILEGLVAEAKQMQQQCIPGSEIFRLYDTYGFPLDITRDILQEQGLTYDETDFQAAMQQQRDRARSHWKGMGESNLKYRELPNSIGRTEFVGYDKFEISAKFLRCIRENEDGIDILIEINHEVLADGETIELVLDKTPFYAEKGGQVADTGWIIGEDALFEVTDVKEPIAGLVVHKGILKKGKLFKDELVTARINHDRRQAIELNHTATHLLHAALCQVLGDHVRQSGSLVAPDRLRFDFTHFSAVKPAELRQIESLVNEHIRTNCQVMTHILDVDEALQRGAMALFDEKYGDRVRMVQVGEISKELCGGTHTKATGDIGLFKITSEASVAAGIRRIEALTGAAAYEYINRQEAELQKAAQLLKSSPAEVVSRLEKLTSFAKQQEKEIQKLQQQLAKSQLDGLLLNSRQINGIEVLSSTADNMDMERLRDMADLLRDKMGSGVVALGTTQGDRVLLVTMVSKDLTDKLHAGKIIQQVAKITGGSGGGRPDMAQAGGKDPQKLSQALQEVYGIVEETLRKALT
jgi:alanyl-tRNA synthetase